MMVERQLVSLIQEYKLHRNTEVGYATSGQTVKGKQKLFNIPEALPRDWNKEQKTTTESR